jgi:hypothetical protein
MAENGIILYEGPSTLDGKPIVVIAIGIADGGRNSKTGPMVQIYILRSDIHPMVASHTGDDFSICGDCRHRGHVETGKDGVRRNVGRVCYVTLMHGPRVVYDAYIRGRYKRAPLKKCRILLAGKKVRVGAYGDPGAAPMEVWDMSLDRAGEINAYTHLWRRFPALSSFCMASCDTEAEREEAKALGFRTFRVRPRGAERLPGEGHCPASAELGKKVQCVSCMLCGGNRVKAKADITIEAHGVGAPHYERSFA